MDPAATPETTGRIGPVGVGGVGGSSSRTRECDPVGVTGETVIGLETLTWIDGRRESCGRCRGSSLRSLVGLSYAGASPQSRCSYSGGGGMFNVPRSPSSVCETGRLDPHVDVGRRTSGSISVVAIDAVLIDEAKDSTRECTLDGSINDGEEEFSAAFCSSG